MRLTASSRFLRSNSRDGSVVREPEQPWNGQTFGDRAHDLHAVFQGDGIERAGIGIA